MADILAAILDDVKDPQQRHNPLFLPYLVDHITEYLFKVKCFPNIVHRKNPGEGVATPPPPHPLYHGGGISLLVRLRVNPSVRQREKYILHISNFITELNIYNLSSFITSHNASVSVDPSSTHYTCDTLP